MRQDARRCRPRPGPDLEHSQGTARAPGGDQGRDRGNRLRVGQAAGRAVAVDPQQQVRVFGIEQVLQPVAAGLGEQVLPPCSATLKQPDLIPVIWESRQQLLANGLAGRARLPVLRQFG